MPARHTPYLKQGASQTSFLAKRGQTQGLNIMTIIGTPSFRRCSYTTGPIIGHYVKLRCHPSVKKNPRGDLFNSPPRASFFSPSGERKGEYSARCSTIAQATNQIARCFPVFNAYGKPFNGRSRSFHRQTCTEPTALTEVLQNLRRAVARSSP